jgi:hypothetical protein
LALKRGDRVGNFPPSLEDDVLIRDLSIPGTHDSAAKRGFTRFERSETQAWNIEEQLSNGVRFLDLRVRIKGTTELAMWHGGDFIRDYYEQPVVLPNRVREMRAVARRTPEGNSHHLDQK